MRKKRGRLSRVQNGGVSSDVCPSVDESPDSTQCLLVEEKPGVGRAGVESRAEFRLPTPSSDGELGQGGLDEGFYLNKEKSDSG